MHCPPAEGNFCDEHGNAIKPAIVADYNAHMGYVDKADRTANSYSISRRTWKWTNKLFFPSPGSDGSEHLHLVVILWREILT
jgi:hypothetical protein